MKLPKGMHVLERGWLSSNNIVFIDDERTAIVDTGYKSHEEQTLQLVQALLAGRPLDAIYNTHICIRIIAAVTAFCKRRIPTFVLLSLKQNCGE